VSFRSFHEIFQAAASIGGFSFGRYYSPKNLHHAGRRGLKLGRESGYQNLKGSAQPLHFGRLKPRHNAILASRGRAGFSLFNGHMRSLPDQLCILE
jgi:hypothetical protein